MNKYEKLVKQMLIREITLLNIIFRYDNTFIFSLHRVNKAKKLYFIYKMAYFIKYKIGILQKHCLYIYINCGSNCRKTVSTFNAVLLVWYVIYMIFVNIFL